MAGPTYPANALNSEVEAYSKTVKADMAVWAAILRRTRVIPAHAADPSGMGELAADETDRTALRNWILHECRIAPTAMRTTGVGMELLPNGTFDAGRINALANDFDQAHMISLKHRDSGTYVDYGRFTLIGREYENED
jgi:hypothetical protein